MDTPKTLYHYTSLSTLALILENRTIRFTRLDKLDDPPQECRTAAPRNIAKTRFASCWTNDARESIPMWREYAGVDCGVRIELTSDPFKRYSWTAEEAERARRAALVYQGGEPGSFSAPLVPFSKAWETGAYIIEYGGGSQTPKKVEYTDDRELLFPVTTEVENGNKVSFAIGKLGVCKATAWSYQKEWRYLLTAMPFSLAETAANGQGILKRCLWFFNDLQDYDKLPEYCDLEISDEAFSSMHVTASPALTEGNWMTLQSLLEKYNPNAELFESALEL